LSNIPKYGETRDVIEIIICLEEKKTRQVALEGVSQACSKVCSEKPLIIVTFLTKRMHIIK